MIGASSNGHSSSNRLSRNRAAHKTELNCFLKTATGFHPSSPSDRHHPTFFCVAINNQANRRPNKGSLLQKVPKENVFISNRLSAVFNTKTLCLCLRINNSIFIVCLSERYHDLQSNTQSKVSINPMITLLEKQLLRRRGKAHISTINKNNKNSHELAGCVIQSTIPTTFMLLNAQQRLSCPSPLASANAS